MGGARWKVRGEIFEGIRTAIPFIIPDFSRLTSQMASGALTYLHPPKAARWFFYRIYLFCNTLLEPSCGVDIVHNILAPVDAHFDVRGGRSGHLPGAVVGYLVSCRPELVGRLHALLDALGNRLVRWHNVAPSPGFSLWW